MEKEFQVKMPPNLLTRFPLNLISENQLILLQFSFRDPEYAAKYYKVLPNSRTTKAHPHSLVHCVPKSCNSVVSAFQTLTISQVTVFPLLN